MDFKDLERKALYLPASQRAQLAHKLLESLDSFPDADVQVMWLDEAEFRAELLDRGTAALVPGDLVARKARTLLR